jgi:hypothetical protein
MRIPWVVLVLVLVLVLVNQPSEGGARTRGG